MFAKSERGANNFGRQNVKKYNSAIIEEAKKNSQLHFCF